MPFTSEISGKKLKQWLFDSRQEAAEMLAEPYRMFYETDENSPDLVGGQSMFYVYDADGRLVNQVVVYEVLNPGAPPTPPG